MLMKPQIISANSEQDMINHQREPISIVLSNAVHDSTKYKYWANWCQQHEQPLTIKMFKRLTKYIANQRDANLHTDS